ncbi:MAG: hypothetical protein JWL77_5362 [Chthonomonadaceae bacterium]|nr:hypothetical protein [Chthonomonadaceae bacterium]
MLLSYHLVRQQKRYRVKGLFLLRDLVLSGVSGWDLLLGNRADPSFLMHRGCAYSFLILWS